MKRSGQVGLAIMGVAAFGATYASVAAYRSSPAPTSSPPAAAAQTCTTRPDGTQNCEPARRGFAYYLLPSFVYGASSNTSSAPKPQAAAFASHAPAPTHGSVAAPPPAAKVQPAALTTSAPASAPKPATATLTYSARPTTPAVSSSGAQRGGFGKTAQSNVRVSAGG
jgi:hypothetical protein